MFGTEYDIIIQYAMIACAVGVLIAIKYFSILKSYQKQLDTYVHPEHLIPDVLAKLNKIPNLDIRVILAQNLNCAEDEPDRMRNIAILLAIMEK